MPGKKGKKRRKRGDRRLLVFIADLHSGHRLGLLNPETVLMDPHDKPFTPGLTETQRAIWQTYTGHLADVVELADGCPVHLYVVGDPIHGKAFTYQMVAVPVKDQVEIAVSALRVWFDRPDLQLESARFLVGTGSHELGEGSGSVLVAGLVKSGWPAVDTRALYLLALRMQGEVVLVAHHGPGAGIREWTRGNVARLYLRDRMMQALLAGEQPPRLVVTAHYHQLVPVTDHLFAQGRWWTGDLRVLPSYSGVDDFTRQATRSRTYLEWGMVVAEFDGGLREIHALVKRIDLRTWEGEEVG